MRSIVASVSAAACAALVCLPASAGEVFAGLGTTGVELGYATQLAPAAGLHIDAEFLNLKRKFDDSGATYDTKLKFSNLGLYGDLCQRCTGRRDRLFATHFIDHIQRDLRDLGLLTRV